MDLPRAIMPELAPGFPPVTILEGPRTCGKTHIARKLAAQGLWERYESLADAATYGLARHDLSGWLESLPATTIIDEAQLIEELPLNVKWLVDTRADRRFLLTGSARLGRASLGGSDPLTGRVRRWGLSPLTLAELRGHPGPMRQLVDRLWSGDILQQVPQASFEVATCLNQGGFPLIALSPRTTKVADQWVRDTTLGLLTDQVLPDDRFDTGTALRVLDGCLRNPSGILNVTSLGQRLALNPRTVERYIDILERRFLLRFLPNLATNPTRQIRARSKTHPVDTAFAVESLRRSDPAVGMSPTISGAVFETWVVNQVVPSLQFAATEVHAFYWRDAKTGREVDLVLADTEGRLVGIEAKSSTQVSLNDTLGLRSLDESADLTRGYVVYPGTKVIRLVENCWALPATALG